MPSLDAKVELVSSTENRPIWGWVVGRVSGRGHSPGGGWVVGRGGIGLSRRGILEPTSSEGEKKDIQFMLSEKYTAIQLTP